MKFEEALQLMREGKKISYPCYVYFFIQDNFIKMVRKYDEQNSYTDAIISHYLILEDIWYEYTEEMKEIDMKKSRKLFSLNGIRTLLDNGRTDLYFNDHLSLVPFYNKAYTDDNQDLKK